MLNIKSVLLGNFRTFPENSIIKLAPLTILTGPNNSGKSSIAGSLSLMKCLDTGKLPFKLKLDCIHNPFGSFDAITNNRSMRSRLTIGYDLYNIVLGEDVRIFFTLKKEGDFDAVVKKISIRNESGILFDLKFIDGRMTSRIDLAYLFSKLKEIKMNKSRFQEIEKNFKNIRSGSGSYIDHSNCEQKESQVKIFKVDSEMKKKKIIDYLAAQDISDRECERLFYLFGKQAIFPDGKPEDGAAKKIRKQISDFEEKEILFNNKLLKRILEIPSDELDEDSLMAVIKNEFPDLYDCLLLLDNPVLITRIINLLKMKNYDEWQSEFLEMGITSTWHITDAGAETEFAEAFEHHLQDAFQKSDFFMTITELSATRDGFLQVYNRYDNLRILASFSELIFSGIIRDLETDLGSSCEMSPNNFNGKLAIDFNDPLHQLFKKYSGGLTKDDFLKPWFRKFNLCDDLLFEKPSTGTSYFPIIRKNNENILFGNEGSGTKKLLTMLLWISCSNRLQEGRDYNDDQKNYPLTAVIEEPESGLNHVWQSKLADMFADAGKKLGMHFLVETHSDIIIDKLRFLVATGVIDKKDVIIYYIDHPEEKMREPGAPRIREIAIDEKGNLSHEPAPGFTDENDNNALEMFRLKKINKN
jgi:AAA15 family ATPase/GTPase